MAIDMFLKLDGVAGESKDKVHSKEIDVLSLAHQKSFFEGSASFFR
jgi:type VI protein secretion system component Hcp